MVRVVTGVIALVAFIVLVAAVAIHKCGSGRGCTECFVCMKMEELTPLHELLPVGAYGVPRDRHIHAGSVPGRCLSLRGLARCHSLYG